jgi:hypothetical protein
LIAEGWYCDVGGEGCAPGGNVPVLLTPPLLSPTALRAINRRSRLME